MFELGASAECFLKTDTCVSTCAHLCVPSPKLGSPVGALPFAATALTKPGSEEPGQMEKPQSLAGLEGLRESTPILPYPFDDSTYLPLGKGGASNPHTAPKLALLQTQDCPAPSPSLILPHQATLTPFPHLEFPHCWGGNRGPGKGAPCQRHTALC